MMDKSNDEQRAYLRSKLEGEGLEAALTGVAGFDKLNDEQRAYLRSTLEGEDLETLLTGVAGFDTHIGTVRGISQLSLDEEARLLSMSLKFATSTKQSSEIIRKLLEKAGTDCSRNDADPYGDGDQRLVQNGEAEAQILRDLFSAGGDLEHWMRESPSVLSPFVWMCINGDHKAVEQVLKKSPRDGEERTQLLEQRVTSMRFTPLILTIAISKLPQTINRYSGRSISQMDHLGVVRILLQYGARPNAREVTGKTGKYSTTV